MGAMGYRGMGNGAYGQCGHRGQWGTGDMGHMDNEPHRGKVVQGVWGHRGQWGMGLWAMRPTGGMGYRGMGHMGNRGTGGMGYKEYGPHGQ